MSRQASSISEAGLRLAEQGAEQGSEKLEWLCRAGYAAKGLVYGTVGTLVLLALYGALGNEALTGTKGAVNTLSDQPFGNVLLGLLIVGLIGYVVWRFAQSLKDTEGKGDDLGGYIQRTGFLISGFFYLSLTWYAISISGWLPGGGGSSSDGSGQQELTARLMSYEAGIWLVGIAGAVFMGLGVYQFYRAVKRKFEKNWKTYEIPDGQLEFARRFAQFGISARAITFLLTGGLLTRAAIAADASQAQGLGYALRSLRDETYGTFLLTVIGAGLICYGLYCFLNARYRTVNV